VLCSLSHRGLWRSHADDATSLRFYDYNSAEFFMSDWTGQCFLPSLVGPRRHWQKPRARGFCFYGVVGFGTYRTRRGLFWLAS
jgi:hypothetical protein